MKNCLFGLICMWLSCQSTSWVSAQEKDATAKRIQRYALLIGVNDYAPPLGKLEFCLNDMQELREHFIAAGFAENNITWMSDLASDSALRPSHTNLDKQLELRLQLANEDDIVVVAFSGHGVHIDGKSYLCPNDARLDETNSLISIEEVYAKMEKCPAAQKVLIIDACRNEPIVRGFKSGKLADDLAIQVESPPKGLIVLSSCEPKQFSAEDAALKHGVFMYYVMQGLRGAADTDEAIGGNGNGRVSLDELYFYAHEKTKTHVANSHGILQRPVMKGEMVGRLDIAMVPSSVKLQELADRAADQQPKLESVASNQPATNTRNVNHRLLTQADAFLRNGDHENAIRAYSAVVDDHSIDSDTRNEARKNRGSAYLARSGKSDIDKALIDQLSAGLPGIRLTVRANTADLKVLAETRGKIKKNQTVLITKINGDWLWVQSVDGSETLQGYITKAAILEQPAPPKPAPAPQPVQSFPNLSNNGNYNNGNYNNNNVQPYNPSRAPSKSSRPPSVWETPEWETPAQIRELRAKGLIR